MMKDSRETPEQYHMAEIRENCQISVGRDGEDLARMGKRQVLKVSRKSKRYMCNQC